MLTKARLTKQCINIAKDINVNESSFYDVLKKNLEKEFNTIGLNAIRFLSQLDTNIALDKNFVGNVIQELMDNMPLDFIKAVSIEGESVSQLSLNPEEGVLKLIYEQYGEKMQIQEYGIEIDKLEHTLSLYTYSSNGTNLDVHLLEYEQFLENGQVDLDKLNPTIYSLASVHEIESGIELGG